MEDTPVDPEHRIFSVPLYEKDVNRPFGPLVLDGDGLIDNNQRRTAVNTMTVPLDACTLTLTQGGWASNASMEMPYVTIGTVDVEGSLYRYHDFHARNNADVKFSVFVGIHTPLTFHSWEGVHPFSLTFQIIGETVSPTSSIVHVDQTVTERPPVTLHPSTDDPVEVLSTYSQANMSVGSPSALPGHSTPTLFEITPPMHGVVRVLHINATVRVFV